MGVKEEIEIIDKYWRAANYRTVLDMYLKVDNNGLKRKLQSSDLQKYTKGHWGTCPGINFIYAHLNHYIKKYHRKIQLVIGPGHGGNALLANLELEGSVKFDEIEFLIKAFPSIRVHKKCSEIRSEVNPYIPGTIYDGGELGYSLAISYGAVMDAKDTLCVCVIGDGEMETGTLASSWQCNELRTASWGMVLPIVHLNGLKMGGKSLISLKEDEELRDFFRGMRYEPWIISCDYHASMLHALEEIEDIYKKTNEGKIYDRVPMIILKTPKGWTAPNFQDVCVEGELLAHKDPLRGLSLKSKLVYLENWLSSYYPEELFDEQGHLKSEVKSLIPEKEYRMGQALAMYKRKVLILPEYKKYFVEITDKNYRNIEILKKYLVKIIDLNKDRFRVFSPDELQSNLLESLECEDKNENRVLEILNEIVSNFRKVL